MGKYDNALYSFLEDKTRFADLFNGVYFDGEERVRAEDLEDDSEKYVEKTAGRPEGRRGKFVSHSRTRDMKRKLKTGGTLRILAVEGQSDVDYTMPWKCMNYDAQEYGRQIREIQRRNKEKGIYENKAERLCRFRRKDRLAPVYTICLYHGQEAWDGPRSLWDMMGEEADNSVWNGLFRDYPLHLFCVNEPTDCTKFHSSLRELFLLLPLRENKEELVRTVREREEFHRLDRETMEVISIMTNSNIILDNMEEYEEEEGRYNMCKALDDLKEEGRELGRAEGRETGRTEGEERAMKLNLRLIEEGRLEDFRRAAEDKAYRDQMFLEFGL